MRTGRRELIRDLNRALVLNLVRERRTISRAEIARLRVTAMRRASGLISERSITELLPP